MLRNFFARQTLPLTGAPAVRRLKSYAAQSGYGYQYFYEGQRPFGSGSESGTEYVFTVSANRKTFHPVSVLVGEAEVRAWEQAHGRELASTERYAVTKMALFQAFDERATPPEMKQDVRVRGADMAAIIETLGL
jgi:hypothetical protein